MTGHYPFQDSELPAYITKIAVDHGIDPSLALAIADHESNGIKQFSARFEPKYKWLFNPDRFASKYVISLETEQMLQRFSYGPMQVMGATARWLGFEDPLPALIYVENSVKYGIMYLKKMLEKYPKELDAIAAYNRGHVAKLENGFYKNQPYVDAVKKKLDKIRSRE